MTIPNATRRRFLELLIAVAAIHIVAIALYYTLEVPGWPAPQQRAFAWSWMGMTVVVVLVGLQRLKRARLRRGADPQRRGRERP